MNAKQYILKNAYFPFEDKTKNVYIKNKVVEKITDPSSLLDEAYSVIDLNKRLTIPGFVNGHMHLDKTLISEKVMNQSGTLTEAIEIMQSYKKKMSKEEVKERAEKVIIFKNRRTMNSYCDVKIVSDREKT